MRTPPPPGRAKQAELGIHGYEGNGWSGKREAGDRKQPATGAPGRESRRWERATESETCWLDWAIGTQLPWLGIENGEELILSEGAKESLLGSQGQGLRREAQTRPHCHLLIAGCCETSSDHTLQDSITEGTRFLPD